MQQLSIPLLARRTDPPTSYRAAERATKFSTKHEALIYGAIFEAGAHGATAKEISAVTGLTDVQVNRRLSGLGRRNVILRKMDLDGGLISRMGCAVWWKT